MVKRSLIIIVCVCAFLACAKRTQEIILVPGRGIVVNTDSILVGKSTPINVAQLLGITDTNQIKEEFLCSVFDSLGNETSGLYFLKSIVYKGMNFKFVGDVKDKLLLSNISVQPNKTLSLKLNRLIVVTDTTVSIINLFPIKDYDYFSDSDMDFSPQGITFQIDTIGRLVRLHKISIHSK